jgi:SAM-dependent methyltransferase
MNYDGYHDTRLAYVEKRARVWKAIAHFLQPWVSGTVVDIGCGYGDFLRFVKAERKIGIDIFKTKGFPDDATFIEAPAWDIAKHTKGNTVFASNLFEHLTDDEVERTLVGVCDALAPGGRLIIVQPNFTYCYKNYFDDYTHKKIFTHVSMQDLLRASGFSIVRCMPRFTPFSMKSSLPVASWLVWLYLRSPIKPGAGQMLIIAETASTLK